MRAEFDTGRKRHGRVQNKMSLHLDRVKNVAAQVLRSLKHQSTAHKFAPAHKSFIAWKFAWSIKRNKTRNSFFLESRRVLFTHWRQMWPKYLKSCCLFLWSETPSIILTAHCVPKNSLITAEGGFRHKAARQLYREALIRSFRRSEA